MTKYYINDQGDYIGGFDGVEPPAGSIEVPAPPNHGRDKYINSAWVPFNQTPTVAERRAVIQQTIDGNEALALAIEWVAEQSGKTKAQAIVEIVAKVK